MKKAARIYRWILISVILQVFFLTYINFFYLVRDGKVTATLADFSDTPKANTSVKIPSGAENIKVSYDGCYGSYILNGKLEIIDLKKNKSVKSISHDHLEFTFYNWLPDRDMVIYSLKAASNLPGEVHVYTYDVDSGTDRNYPKIGGLPKGSEITDIELSPLTNVVYTKIKIGSSQYKIYKYDIMDTLSYVMNTSSDIIIKETNYSDTLVYQIGNDKIYVKNTAKGTLKQLQFKNKMVLLAVDSDDNIFTGEVQDGGMVSTVYYGKQTEDIDKKWKKVTLDHPASIEDIVISPDGVVYTVSQQDNEIYNVEKGKTTSYSGKLLNILEGFVVSLNNNSLKVKTIK